jgi:hypothetical protein
MITAIQAAHVLQTCVVAIIGITTFFKILPMQRLDCFRQNMFAVRDELLDYAAAGNISFNDPAYIVLRHQMNGMIRYGHQLTLFRVLVTWLMRFVSGEVQIYAWHDAWEKALGNLKSDAVRDQLAAFHNRSAAVAAKHLLSGSLVLWCALALTAFALFLRGAVRGTTQLLSAAARTILSSGPVNQRIIEEDAVCAIA